VIGAIRHKNNYAFCEQGHGGCEEKWDRPSPSVVMPHDTLTVDTP